jgi:RNA polymerase sigma-70 factor (ECF subfamily)
MEPDSTGGTSVSLLLRLRQEPADQTAWRDFVRRYGRRIYLWCRQWQLQDADAEDVTQNVLVILAEKLREFRYDPAGSFRAWLKTVAHHAWGKYVAGLQRPGRGSGDSGVLPQLHAVAARDDLAAKLEEEFDRELLDFALLRVAQRVEPHTWQAFHQTAMEGRSAAETAARLSVPVATVYVARSRVQKMVQEEIRQLESGHLGKDEG